ncbi:MAG TPA: phosphoglycerate dehydrogenase [Phycisphaerales bacterium]|nr:phosphoglycerate dehydrogenase [Phycisphaerales bacterium]
MNASARPVVVVTETLSQRALDYLREHVEVRKIAMEDVERHIADADALIVRTYTQVRPPLLDQAKKLKVVGRAGVALENIDVPACRQRGIEVVHTPEANTLAVVDYTTRMMIEMNRRFWPLAGHVPPEEFHKIRKQAFGRFLSSCTLGIVGCGRIGSRVGRIAAAMGMTVLYNDIKPIRLDYPAQAVDKPTLYARSDIVTIHVPMTDLTRKFINAGSLAQFKDGAQFINAARGQCVDSAALADALRAGRLSAAVIDCHDPEPPPPDYPLFHLGDKQGNVILTPHAAARVPEAMERMSDVVYDIVAILSGQVPKFPAQPDAWGGGE